jgi:rhomboid family GlyGly-CTERM serine protease
MGQMISNLYNRMKDILFQYRPTVDMAIFWGLLAVANSHLVGVNFTSWMIFLPDALTSGQWWRFITYHFVHVSWYHLFLDAGAFFLLYSGLAEKRLLRRILYVIVCGATSLTAALIFSPLIYTQGLCGLSGIAHGLMAISALEMMGQKENFRVGLLSLALVFSKSIYEAIVGDVFFAFLHFGLCGTPLAVCHAGGVFGGILMLLAFKAWRPLYGSSGKNFFFRERRNRRCC